jgi:hypothetical protein
MNHTLISHSLSATFDLDSLQMLHLENRITGERMVLAPRGGITLELEQGVVELPGVQAKLLEADDHCLQVHYASDLFEVEVAYTLQQERHFLHQQVCFRPRFEGPYLVRRIVLQQFGLPGDAAALVPFQHGQCRTYFLRQQAGGFMFGVMVPVLDEEQDDLGHIVLGYPVNYRFEAAEDCVAETLFWGAYRLTGRRAPPVAERVKECVQSTRPPDHGESEAMLAMVKTMLERPWRGPVVAVNGCMNKTTLDPYDEEHRASVEADKQFFIRAQDMLGECIIQTYPTWAGAQVAVHGLTSRDTRLPEMPVRDEFLQWSAANGFRVCSYTPLKGPFPWNFCGRELFVYCRDRPEWQGQCDDPKCSNRPYNCPVNRPYMRWLTQVLTDDLRRHPQIGEWVLDESLPAPRYRLPCTKTGHDHLPGDAAYGYFLARRNLFRTIGREFPGIVLNGERPNMDAGIWDALYLDSLFTLSEMADGVNSDMRRCWSRIRHYYHFVPASLDEALITHFNAEDPDYIMLSALAVSCNYLVGELPRDWSRVALRRVRRWVDWARRHAELMQESRFLPDWPFQGRCDGYVRVGEREAYAFFFNSNDRPAAAVLALDESAGLVSGASYRLALEHATGRAAPLRGETVTTGQMEFSLPAHTAALLRIERA